MSPMVRRILVPVDGEELTDKAVEVSIGFAHQLGAAIVGFLVEPLAPLPTAARTKSMVDHDMQVHDAQVSAHARPVLQRFAAAAQAAGVPFEGVFEMDDRVDRAIINAAEAQRCDLIIMVTHGRGTFGELLFGSQTKAVMAGCSLPVLVLR